MRKRFLSILTALAITLTLLPAAALASGESVALQYDDYVAAAEVFGASSADDIQISSDGDILEVRTEEGQTYVHAAGVGTATVTVGDQAYTVEVTPAKVNVVLVSGQSNAAGVHGSLDQSAIAPEQGNGYIWTAGGLEDLSTYVAGLDASKSVGWYPALAAEWYALTGEKTVIIHECSSGSPISVWASYEDGTVTARTTGIANTVKNCIQEIQGNTNYEIVRTGYYWLQGETDAFLDNQDGITDYTTAERYETAYMGMHSAFVDALTIEGIQPYGAILSCRTRTNGDYMNIEYCGMRVAQQDLANQNSDIYMASVMMEEWRTPADTYSYEAASGAYAVSQTAGGIINSIHYNQSGYNMMGLDAADNMYAALKDSSAVSDVEPIGHDGYTKYAEGAAIIAEDNARVIGANNAEEDTGKAQIVARPLPISAECSSVTMTLTDSAGQTVSGVMDQRGLIDIAALKTAVAKNGGAGLTLTVTAGSVSKTYTLTSEAYAEEPSAGADSFHYKWDFTVDGTYAADGAGKVTVTSVFDENTLTYTDSAATHDENGLTNTNRRWFALDQEISLDPNEPWTIRWQGSTSDQSVLLAANDADEDTGNKKAGPYIYLFNDNQGKEGFEFAEDTGHSLDLRLKDLSPTVRFTQIPGTARQDVSAVWSLENDGEGNLTLTVSSDNRQSYSQTKAIAVEEPLVFNGVLGNFNGNFCYTGTIAYVELYTPGREEEMVLTEIQVTTPPDQIIYEAGDTFDAEGMVVTAVYSDSTEKPVSGYTVTPDVLAADTTEVTISYTEGGKTVTAVQTVSVGSQSAGTSGRNYSWDFSKAAGGNTLEAESGEGLSPNTLTYSSNTIPGVIGGALTNAGGYFTADTPIILSENQAWTIEWKGSTTGNSVVLAENDDADSGSSKAGAYLYVFQDNGEPFSLSLREKNTTGIVTFNDIDEDIRSNADAVWRLHHDGTGGLTLTITADGQEVYNKTIRNDGVNRDYQFNGVLGRFTTTNTLSYTGAISYLKAWENVVPVALEVTLKDADQQLQIGETLERDDVVVIAVYNDGTKEPVADAECEITSVSYEPGGEPVFTVSAVMDGLIISGQVRVHADNTGYHWDFTDADVVTGSNQLPAAAGSTENTLTYSKDTLTLDDGFAADGTGYFTMAQPVTLLKDAPWTIEWKGTTNGQSILLANNDADQDTTSPRKAGEYLYIYNDLGIELGNSVSLRKENTTAAATFTGLSDAAREDPNAVWKLIHDGQGNLSLACESDDLTSVVELEDVIDQDYTFNAVLGYFTANNRLCYKGTIQDLKIYPTAAAVTATEGTLDVGIPDGIKTNYNVGEEPNVDGLTVTFTPEGGSPVQITNYTYTTQPALIASDTTQITVTVSAFGKTAEETISVTVNANEPASFHWTDVAGSLTSQTDDGAVENALTAAGNDRYYTMARPVSLTPDNHWRIEWTGSVEEDTNGVLLSANTVGNADTALRSTPYIYIRNGGDNGQYDISLVPGGMIGSAVAQFKMTTAEEQAALGTVTTWTLDYNEDQLTLSNNQGYSQTQAVTLDAMVFNGICGYFAVSFPLYYQGTVKDLKIYEQYTEDTYRWDFNASQVSGSTLNATRGDIDLTYTAGTIPASSEGLANVHPNYFTMADGKAVTLADDSPWTIEWKGITSANSVLLAQNSAGDSGTEKEGPYIYIFNDAGTEFGNRIALRTGDLSAAATFTIPDGLREDPDITWYLVHDGQGNLTLGWKGSDDLYYTSTQQGVIDQDFVFDGVLGCFTPGSLNLSYTGTIQYLEISMEAKKLTNAEGTLDVDVSEIASSYQAGDTLDLSGLKVTYTIGDDKADVTNYQVSTNPAFLTPETTSVVITVTALGETANGTVAVTVSAADPQYYHWAETSGQLTAGSDGTGNSLTDQGSYYDMASPVYLDPDNHWRIEWTGSITEGRNGVLMSENDGQISKNTPYLYIRNGGDNGEYDISLVYRGVATVGDNSSNLVRFNLEGDAKEALSAQTVWTLDYDNGTLTLSNNSGYTAAKSVTVPDIAFNGIGGYFTTGNSMSYVGTLTDVKIYEALYDVTVSSASNGTITAVPSADVYPGAPVTLTNTPASGYELDAYTVIDAFGNPVSVTGNAFTMPQSDVTVSATFKQISEDTSDGDNNRPSGGGSSEQPSYSPILDISDGGSIKINPRTPEEDEDVTITIDPDRGYEVGSVTVTDRNGREVDVTAERDGTYTFTQPYGRVTIEVTFVPEGTSAFFIDVPESFWAYDEIKWAYNNGYVNGTSATTFSPNNSITRQQVWMILARLSGADPADMTEAREWAMTNGISDGTIPGNPVTRQQLVALLYRYADMMGYANDRRADLSGFPDAETVSSYAVEPMQWSVANGIVGGTSAGTLDPTGTATRAQFAVILYRFWNQIER